LSTHTFSCLEFFQWVFWEQVKHTTCGQSGLGLPDGNSATAAVDSEVIDGAAAAAAGPLDAEPAPTLSWLTAIWMLVTIPGGSSPTGRGCLTAPKAIGTLPDDAPADELIVRIGEDLAALGAGRSY
jgi:hypothetical protein